MILEDFDLIRSLRTYDLAVSICLDCVLSTPGLIKAQRLSYIEEGAPEYIRDLVLIVT